MATTPTLRAIDLCIPLADGTLGLQETLRGLKPCWGDLAGREARLLIVCDGPATEGLDKLLKGIPRTLPVQVLTSDKPVGLARSTNQALLKSAGDGRDVLILQAGTLVTAGDLAALLKATDDAPQIGLACPRSNTGLLAALPWDGAREATHEQVRADWGRIGRTMPDWQAVPGVDGPCLFIRHGVLSEHGGWAELFGLSSGFELDLSLRAAATGWLSVVVNRAFVHRQPRPAGTGAQRQLTARQAAHSRRLLEGRHPGLDERLQRHDSSTAARAARLLAGLRLDAGGRLRVALDLSGLNQMTEAATQRCVATVLALVRAASPHLQFTALCDLASFRRHRLHEAAGLTREDIALPSLHAVALSCTPLVDMAHVRRLHMVAPVVLVLVSDLGPMPAQTPAEHTAALAFQTLIAHANGLLFLSETLARSLPRLLPEVRQTPQVVFNRAASLADYSLPLADEARQHILVLSESPLPPGPDLSIQALARSQPGLRVVQAAQRTGRYGEVDAVDWRSLSPTGRLTLLAQAQVLVLPGQSAAHPDWLLAARATGKPVVARRQAAHEEGLALLATPTGVRLYQDEQELILNVQAALADEHRPATEAATPDASSCAHLLEQFCMARCAADDIHALLARRLAWACPAPELQNEPDTTAEGSPTASSAGPELATLLEQSGEDFVRQAYRMLLRREADPEGLTLYVSAQQRGASKAAILLALSQSSEALMIGARPEGLDRWLVGELDDLLQRDGKSFVERAFLTFLLRPADELGLARYLQLLEQGADKLSLMAELLRSPEGRTRGVKFSGVATLLRQHLRKTPVSQVRRLK